jgi:hypothetical protein
MCALFGSSRDVSMIRKVNRELLGNVISQQCVFYKVNLNQTTSNIYGEASDNRFFNEPVLLNAIITISDNSSPVTDFGVDFAWPIKFAFLRDDLVDSNVHPEVGDIILYQESYWEIDNNIFTKFFVGKDPDYPYSQNPINPGLENFGYNVSVVCECHYVPSDRLNIIKSRL